MTTTDQEKKYQKRPRATLANKLFRNEDIEALATIPEVDPTFYLKGIEWHDGRQTSYLHLLAMYNQGRRSTERVIEALQDQNLDINGKDSFGDTPYDLAMQTLTGKTDPDLLMQSFLHCGVDCQERVTREGWIVGGLTGLPRPKNGAQARRFKYVLELLLLQGVQIPEWMIPETMALYGIPTQAEIESRRLIDPDADPIVPTNESPSNGKLETSSSQHPDMAHAQTEIREVEKKPPPLESPPVGSPHEMDTVLNLEVDPSNNEPPTGVSSFKPGSTSRVPQPS